MHPKKIDAETVPPPSGSTDYVTRDLEIELERVVARLIDDEVAASGVSRRQAAKNVQKGLEALLRK